MIFVIDDELHAESQGEYDSLDEAISELRRRAALPWNQTPNIVPCADWKTCGRSYEIVEYDQTSIPWKELRRIPALKISASELAWSDELKTIE